MSSMSENTLQSLGRPEKIKVKRVGLLKEFRQTGANEIPFHEIKGQRMPDSVFK